MKNEKGITLIALIITIIIMLILVIVTISFAMNGGLFQKAKEGAEKTQHAITKEELIVAMAGGYEIGGEFVRANVVLPDGAKWGNKFATYETASGTGNWVITSDGQKYFVDGNGMLLDEDNLIPTAKEKADLVMGHDALTIASGPNDFVLEYSDSTVEEEGDYYGKTSAAIQLNANGETYIWFCNDISAEVFTVMLNVDSPLEVGVWYTVIMGEQDSVSFEEYDGPCPFDESDFSVINSQSYLERIIDSFPPAE